jgi:hypothetical protein
MRVTGLLGTALRTEPRRYRDWNGFHVRWRHPEDADLLAPTPSSYPVATVEGQFSADFACQDEGVGVRRNEVVLGDEAAENVSCVRHRGRLGPPRHDSLDFAATRVRHSDVEPLRAGRREEQHESEVDPPHTFVYVVRGRRRLAAPALRRGERRLTPNLLPRRGNGQSRQPCGNPWAIFSGLILSAAICTLLAGVASNRAEGSVR